MTDQELNALALMQSILLRNPDVSAFLSEWVARLRQVPEADRKRQMIEDARIVIETMLKAGMAEAHCYSMPYAVMCLAREQLGGPAMN